MEMNKKDDFDNMEKKLKKTANEIIKSRKNHKLAEKETAEFEEIWKFIQNIEVEISSGKDFSLSSETIDVPLECSIIPLSKCWLSAFNEELIFSLFNEESICLSNFIQPNENFLFTEENKFLANEDVFRRLLSSHAIENLMSERGESSSISLYVFYLMSVHQNPDVVTACFHFLNLRQFRIQIHDILTIFVNYGVEIYEGCNINEEMLLKFRRTDGNIDKIPSKPKFPFFNLKMVGKILIRYVTENLLVYSSDVKSLVKIALQINLDSKIRMGCLAPIYSTFLSLLCLSIKDRVSVEEIANWLLCEHEEERKKPEDLLIQIEICRMISKSIFFELHETLTIRTICRILKSENLAIQLPLKIEDVKLILQKLKKRKIFPLEIYCILQIINGSLPGITATFQDSVEIKSLLTYLDQKMSKTEDSVDLIRLKLEIAKVGNLLADKTFDRFTVDNSFRYCFNE